MYKKRGFCLPRVLQVQNECCRRYLRTTHFIAVSFLAVRGENGLLRVVLLPFPVKGDDQGGDHYITQTNLLNIVQRMPKIAKSNHVRFRSIGQ